MTAEYEVAPLLVRIRLAWAVVCGRAERDGAGAVNESGDEEGKSRSGSIADTVKAPERLIDLAERAYKEVLDATKHQDDKVGRFLTAIAFLTTGAIALIGSGGALGRQFGVPNGGEHPLLAYATAGFFVLTLASVALLLLCLSVPIRLPKASDDHMNKSHLFYSYIANRPRDEWIDHWKTSSPEDLERSMAGDYFGETHNLAERTSAKYRHSYEASWLFVCALLFLGAAVYLRVIAEFEPDTAPTSSLGVGHLIGFAVIASLHAGLQIYTRWVHDVRSLQRARDFSKRTHPPVPAQVGDGDSSQEKMVVAFNRNVTFHRQRRWTLSLIASTTIFSVVLALPVEDARWGLAIALGIIGIATAVPTWLTRQVWDADNETTLKRRHVKSWWFPVVATGAAVGGASAALHADGVWRVAAIISPPLITGMVNLSRPAHSNLLARRLRLKPTQAEVSTK